MYGHFYGVGLAQGDDQTRPAPPRPPPPRVAAPAGPPPMNTWARWQEVHPGSSYEDYQIWWVKFGQHGATIQPDAPKKKGGFNLGKTLGSIGKVAMTVAPIVAMALGDSLTGQDASTVAPVGVNPLWVRLAQVLNEVSAGFRMTGVPLRSDQETFLRVVEHLAQVVNGLALAPNDPALLAEYQELSDFLAAHPDSEHLAAFIATHPKIVPVVVPAQVASTGYVYG
jgi:hypothetical protein